MKPGDIVKFIDGKVRILHKVAKSSLSASADNKMYLRQDIIGIVIKKHEDAPYPNGSWIVNFPQMGGLDAYSERWLEVISEL